jgi:Methyltransferase domain
MPYTPYTLKTPIQTSTFGGPDFRGLEAPPERHAMFIEMVKRFDGPVSVLEVGSFMGHSALSWANAIHKLGKTGTVWCIDPWKPYFKDNDLKVNQGIARQNQMMAAGEIKRLFDSNIRYAPETVTIVPIQSTFKDAAKHLHSFDIIYLDGSHYYEDVRNDINWAFNVEFGLLCGDDLEIHPREISINAADLDYDCVTLADGRWYHAGVCKALSDRFDLDRIHMKDGFWWVE